MASAGVDRGVVGGGEAESGAPLAPARGGALPDDGRAASRPVGSPGAPLAETEAGRVVEGWIREREADEASG